MSKALVIIKSMGIGDLVILIGNIHAISKKINKPITVLAQKNTHANAILKNDPHVEEVIILDKEEIKGFFNIIKKIKPKQFDQSYIFSDSIRLYLISKLSGIKENFHYKFFSKKGKNFFKTAKEFTEKTLNTEINSQPKIYVNENDMKTAKNKYNITDETKNIVCGISASGPTKRWDINNYIKLFENLNLKFKCKFFLAGGPDDEDLVKKVMNSSVGKNCISFAAMDIAETMPIIAACKYCISNDTGFGHISAGLGLKSLMLFIDSPPAAYGLYNKNISILVPEGETIETTTHDTMGTISVDEVLKNALELMN
ncbi:MAG: glycosyltransferase family 9 protein [Pelagibacteraceae bacterium]|nr:glycosyltransferase family 9 protein [Pelagibacteraceae bacterium]